MNQKKKKKALHPLANYERDEKRDQHAQSQSSTKMERAGCNLTANITGTGDAGKDGE